mmetsp:Transcript_24919/g.36761  ORF Transcript_24919/g.36761 Transcript_24919/m.36761 type:complete len:273 (+) Transcript_24919:329-1147(+)
MQWLVCRELPFTTEKSVLTRVHQRVRVAHVCPETGVGVILCRVTEVSVVQVMKGMIVVTEVRTMREEDMTTEGTTVVLTAAQKGDTVIAHMMVAGVTQVATGDMVVVVTVVTGVMVEIVDMMVAVVMVEAVGDMVVTEGMVMIGDMTDRHRLLETVVPHLPEVLTEGMIKEVLTKDLIREVATEDMIREVLIKDLIREVLTEDMIREVPMEMKGHPRQQGGTAQQQVEEGALAFHGKKGNVDLVKVASILTMVLLVVGEMLRDKHSTLQFFR